MGPWEKASGYLAQKVEIIEKIAANTEKQSRFIHEREMRGLGRLLGERAKLLEELATVIQELANNPDWKNVPALAPMIQDSIYKQQKLLERSSEVLQEAVAERALIATELKNYRINRQVKNGYVHPWAKQAWGRLINERG